MSAPLLDCAARSLLSHALGCKASVLSCSASPVHSVVPTLVTYRCLLHRAGVGASRLRAIRLCVRSSTQASDVSVARTGLSGSSRSVVRLGGRYPRSCKCIGPRHLTCCLHTPPLGTQTSLLAAVNVCESGRCPPPTVLVRAWRTERPRSTRVDWTAVRYCVAPRTAVAVVVVDRVVSFCRSLSCRCGLDSYARLYDIAAWLHDIAAARALVVVVVTRVR